MNKIISISVRVAISLILSGSALSGAVAIFRYADPGFSVSLLDLLLQYSVPAWLLLGLSTAVVFVILSKLPIVADRESANDGEPGSKSEQSD